MNSFGSSFRVSLFGESHGPAVGALVEGCPPGLALDVADFEADLARRRGAEKQNGRPRPPVFCVERRSVVPISPDCRPAPSAD